MAQKSFKQLKKPAQPTDSQVAAFIRGGTGNDNKGEGPTKRLSVDVPEELHTRFKVACALTRSKMGPEIIAFIEKRTAELESEAGRG